MAGAEILIVEDESIVAKDLQCRLKALGYQVSHLASSAEEALAKAAEVRPDLVLMDIRIKGRLDGIETAAEMRRRFHVPVVYLTAYADNHTLQRAKVTEPFGYILKPFEERELQTCIEMALYKHQMERKVKEGQQWLVTTLRCIGEAVIATGAEGRIRLINPVAERMTGWRESDALEKDLSDVFKIRSSNAREPADMPVPKVIRSGQQLDCYGEATLVGKDGAATPIDYSMASIKNDAEIIGVVLCFRDVSERKHAEEKLRYLSTHDILTGLYNRAYYEEELARLEHGRHFPVSVIVADVDSLKAINDRLGHAAGDQLLRDAAKVFKDAFRAEDLVARLGGDEFAVLLPSTGAEALDEALARVRESLAAYNAAHECPLALSIGATTVVSGRVADALEKADKLMYSEKLRQRARAS